MESIKTKRLELRQWNEKDFGNFARYYADEDNARYVGGQKDTESAWRHMALLIGHWQLKGFGYWAVDVLVYGSPPAGLNWSLAIGWSKSIKEKATRSKHVCDA